MRGENATTTRGFRYYQPTFERLSRFAVSRSFLRPPDEKREKRLSSKRIRALVNPHSSPGPDLRTFPRLDPFRRFLFPPRSPRASRARPSPPLRPARLGSKVAPDASARAAARRGLGEFFLFFESAGGLAGVRNRIRFRRDSPTPSRKRRRSKGFPTPSFLSPRPVSRRLESPQVHLSDLDPTPAGGARTSSGARAEARRAPSPTTREGPASRAARRARACWSCSDCTPRCARA